MFKMLLKYNYDCMMKNLSRAERLMLAPLHYSLTLLITMMEYYFSSPKALEETLDIIIEHNKGKVN